MSPTSIFFVSSAILEGGAEHSSDAIGSKGAGEVVSEARAKLLLDLTNALLGHAKGLGAALVVASEASNNARAEDLGVSRLEAGSEGFEGLSDALAVLCALHRHILTQSTRRDDRADSGSLLVAYGLVDAHTARGHGTQASCDIIDIEVQVSGDGLWRGVLADDLAGLLKRGPQLLGSAGATVERTGVGLHVLLTTGSHPLLGVGREAGSVADLVLGRSVDDALARLGEQVVEVNTVTHVLLGDLVSEAHVGGHKVVGRLLDLRLCALWVLNDADTSNLLGSVEDDAGSGEGREKCCHCVAS